MINRKLSAVVFGCLLAFASLVMPLRANAAVQGATIAVVSGGTLRSTVVNSMAIVTSSGAGTKSQIDIYFNAVLPNGTTAQIGLHITSADQRRIEAFYSQILAANGRAFQITAYATASATANNYDCNLETSRIYLLNS